jgi:pimeloyl-ACP methyl ester carboxylesterase
LQLGPVTGPALLVWVARFCMVRASAALHVLVAVPPARYVELDGCGHCPQLEEPEAFADLLLEFQAQRAGAYPGPS